LGVFFLASETFRTRLRKRAWGGMRKISDDDLCLSTSATRPEAPSCSRATRSAEQTINGARGFHPKIADRPDLTLRCIRRHYPREWNPLVDTLGWYADFFALFEDFGGYVDFFLLQDLVEDDGRTSRFFHPFADFSAPAVPGNIDDYLSYLRASNAFIHARNRKIVAYFAGRRPRP
jgi:hypothetical protein